MLQGSYGKEPFDLRLTVLRMMRRFHIIILFTLAGTLLFGGGYYVKNVLLRGEPLYSAVSTYKVEYADEAFAQNGTYINGTTWNTYVHTEEFLEMVQERLGGAQASGEGDAGQEGVPEGQNGADNPQKASGAQAVTDSLTALGEMLQADLPSDLRVMTITVTAKSPEACLQTAAAVEAAMTEDFPRVTTEVSSIRVIDWADEASEVIPDVRPGRAFVLSAVLSFFFAAVIFLLKETWNDSIWLPAALRRRYGLATLGTIHSKELAVHAAYLFGGKEKIAVVPADAGIDPAEAAAQLAERMSEDTAVNQMKAAAQLAEKSSSMTANQGDRTGEETAVLREAEADAARIENGNRPKQQWIPVPSPLLSPEVCGTLREMDGILLVVRAGSHSGKPLEYVLEYLGEQDFQVTAALLWEADELLIRSYYGFRGEKESL